MLCLQFYSWLHWVCIFFPKKSSQKSHSCTQRTGRAWGITLSPILVHFITNSLIPKMSMFTLAISCLTMCNLPWFMDLTFQVPMQYFCLQNQTLLSPPDITTTECHFCFVPAISFFLELLVNCPQLFPRDSLVAQIVKKPPAVHKIWVQSLVGKKS